MAIRFQNCTLADMTHVARKILLAFPDERFLHFMVNSGQEDYLIKAFCDVLKVNDEVTSPSFQLLMNMKPVGSI
jgi:hypothetical protein